MELTLFMLSPLPCKLSYKSKNERLITFQEDWHWQVVIFPNNSASFTYAGFIPWKTQRQEVGSECPRMASFQQLPWTLPWRHPGMKAGFACLWAPSHSWKAEFRKCIGEVKIEPHLLQLSKPIASRCLHCFQKHTRELIGCLTWCKRNGRLFIGLAVKVGVFSDCRTGTIFFFRYSLNTKCWKAHGCQVNVYWAKTYLRCRLIALVWRL